VQSPRSTAERHDTVNLTRLGSNGNKPDCDETTKFTVYRRRHLPKVLAGERRSMNPQPRRTRGFTLAQVALLSIHPNLEACLRVKERNPKQSIGATQMRGGLFRHTSKPHRRQTGRTGSGNRSSLYYRCCMVARSRSG
jgi:hypothetical protein